MCLTISISVTAVLYLVSSGCTAICPAVPFAERLNVQQDGPVGFYEVLAPYYYQVRAHAAHCCVCLGPALSKVSAGPLAELSRVLTTSR